MAAAKQILLLIETSRVFGRGVIEGISRYGKQHADWLFHFEDRGILEELPPWLRNWQGDGILVRSPTRALSSALTRFHCPVVELLGDGITTTAEVVSDEHLTATYAIDHLCQQGFEHLAFYSFANSWWSDARRDAFAAIVDSRGLSGHVFPGAYKGTHQPYPVWRQAYASALSRWLDELPKPVGVWAVADSQAVRVLEACREANLRVPAEIGILGTSNEDVVCGLLTPSLSSIDLNAPAVGYHAAALLDTKINAQRKKQSARSRVPQFQPILVPPAGVVMRQSTDRIAIVDPELDEAMKIIQRSALIGLTVDELADATLLSRSTLERRFRDVLQCTPSQAINHVRIERAKTLLRETAWPISTIGLKTGFNSPENFVRFFKRLVGETPRQYRIRFYA